MKIVRATEQDIQAAERLVSMLEAVSSGMYPPHFDIAVADQEEFDEFDENDPEHLKAFYKRVMACVNAAPGGIGRVVWNIDTLMRNNVFDLDSHTLELHPSLVRKTEEGKNVL